MKRDKNSDKQKPRRRVLIADDDPVILYTIKEIVGELYEVVGEATDGKEAVELAIKLRPDLVLLDMSMPILTGIEAAGQIRKDLPKVRIIIVSNHMGASYVDEALRGGAQGYVFKAFAMVQIPEAIEDVLGGRIFRPEESGHRKS